MTLTANKIALTGVYSALCIVIGMILAPIPNIELITLFIFFGGMLFGPKRGLLIGFISYFFFSAFNFWGSGLAYPPLLAGQVVAMGSIGFAGGFIRLNELRGSVSTRIIFGICGFACTLFYHVLITLFTYKFSGFNFEQLRVTMFAGIMFSMWHFAANILSFAILIPLLIKRSRTLNFMK